MGVVGGCCTLVVDCFAGDLVLHDDGAPRRGCPRVDGRLGLGGEGADTVDLHGLDGLDDLCAKGLGDFVVLQPVLARLEPVVGNRTLGPGLPCAT